MRLRIYINSFVRRIDSTGRISYGNWNLYNTKYLLAGIIKMEYPELSDETIENRVVGSFRAFTSEDVSVINATNRLYQIPTIGQYIRMMNIFKSFSHTYNKKTDKFNKL